MTDDWTAPGPGYSIIVDVTGDLPSDVPPAVKQSWLWFWIAVAALAVLLMSEKK